MTQPRHQPSHCPHCEAALSLYVQQGQLPTYCPQCHFPLCLIAGKYQLTALLAEGGFGKVYQASHVELPEQPPRAIKILKAARLDDPGVAQRFRREIEITARLSLQTPHVVRVYDDFGLAEPLGYFYVMEYLKGQSLQLLLSQQGGLSMAAITHIFTQLCAAIQVIHDAQILHRDLKPSNILLVDHGDDDLFVKIIDFGIARLLAQASPGLTQGPLGTPTYMAPEQWLHKAVSPATDVYALGVILYEMMTGTPPFSLPEQAAGSHDLMYFHVHQPAPSLSAKGRGPFSPALEAVVNKALAKRPGQRFATVEAMGQAFREAVDDASPPQLNGGTAARSQPSPQPTPAGGSLQETLPPPAMPARMPLQETLPPPTPEELPAGPSTARPLQETLPPPATPPSRMHLQETQPPPPPDVAAPRPAPLMATTLDSDEIHPTPQAMSKPQASTAPPLPPALPSQAEGASGWPSWMHLLWLLPLIFGTGFLGIWLGLRLQPNGASSPGATTTSQRQPPRPSAPTPAKQPATKAPSRRPWPRLARLSLDLGAPEKRPPRRGGIARVDRRPSKRMARDDARRLKTPRRRPAQRRSQQRPPPRPNSRTPARTRRRNAPARRALTRRAPAPRATRAAPPRQSLPSASSKATNTLAPRRVKGCPDRPLHWTRLVLSKAQRLRARPHLPQGGTLHKRRDGFCVGVTRKDASLVFGHFPTGFVPCRLRLATLSPQVRILLQREGGMEPESQQYCWKR